RPQGGTYAQSVGDSPKYLASLRTSHPLARDRCIDRPRVDKFMRLQDPRTGWAWTNRPCLPLLEPTGEAASVKPHFARQACRQRKCTIRQFLPSLKQVNYQFLCIFKGLCLCKAII